MTVMVNPPPQVRIPEQFLADPELAQFFRNQQQILFQLWNRTGGNDDLVDNTSQNLTSTGSRVSRNAARINSLELKNFEVVNVTTNFTTDRNQILICKNSTPIDITLDPQAVFEDEVHVKRRDAEVNIIGTVDGLTDITLNVELFSVHLVFDGTDWSQV